MQPTACTRREGRREGDKEGGIDKEEAEEGGDAGSPNAGACLPAFVCVAAEFPNPASPTPPPAPPPAFRAKTLPVEPFGAAGVVVDFWRTATDECSAGADIVLRGLRFTGVCRGLVMCSLSSSSSDFVADTAPVRAFADENKSYPSVLSIQSYVQAFHSVASPRML